MRKWIAFVIAAVALSAAPAARSQETPRWEFFGGYSYVDAYSGASVVPVDEFGTFPDAPFPIDLGHTMNGWHGAVSENVNSWFSGVADFGGGYRSVTLNYTSVGGPVVLTTRALYTYQFGPQFSLRKFSHVTLFGHGLVGGADNRVSYATGTRPKNDNAWAFQFGGGVDVQVSHLLAVRVIEADWIRTHQATSLTSASENNWSASAGLVLRIGGH